MDNIAVAFVVVMIVLLLLMHISTKERLINEMDYRDLTRGCSRNSTYGYRSTMDLISAVDHAQANDFIPLSGV